MCSERERTRALESSGTGDRGWGVLRGWGSVLRRWGKAHLLVQRFYKMCPYFINAWTCFSREYVYGKSSEIFKGKTYTTKEGRKLIKKKEITLTIGNSTYSLRKS